jgi:cytoplasmic iron level regulating protein YaaA (DUF328/UPF0246 family)
MPTASETPGQYPQTMTVNPMLNAYTPTTQNQSQCQSRVPSITSASEHFAKVSEIAAQYEAAYPSYTPEQILQIVKHLYAQQEQHWEQLQQQQQPQQQQQQQQNAYRGLVYNGWPGAASQSR